MSHSIEYLMFKYEGEVMPGPEQVLHRLHRAFLADGFQVTGAVYTPSGRIGLEARHILAANYDTGERKKSYYIEGTPYERGYLLGLLAEPEISDMAVNFAGNIVYDYIDMKFLNSFPAARELIVSLIYGLSRNTWASQPQHVLEEIEGMIEGCKKRNPSTRVDESRLVALNAGFDLLCALVYTGKFLEGIIPRLFPADIRLPMMCNAFSVFGGAAAGEHFFGRDFMFVTAGVLQNHIAHIITLPLGGNPQDMLYPFVNITAPGLAGSPSAMNIRGVAGGVNMSPAANCDVDNIGFNSLLLLRESIMRAGSALSASGVIQNAKRGVSWNYALSDGYTDTACTVEAGASWKHTDVLSYPAKELLSYLPSQEFLSSHVTAPLYNGCAVRWCGAPFPDSFYKFNRGLWDNYNASYGQSAHLFHDAFFPGGFINRTPHEKNCPASLYFAPQRTGRDVHITTNHFLLPHMRLAAMHPWTATLVQRYVNDIQWRYDELNHQIRRVLFERGAVDYIYAKRLIDFLAPYGKFPQYYHRSPKSADGKQTRIEGCTTLFDLKRLTAESHYGYYCDDWVKTTLPAYFS